MGGLLSKPKMPKAAPPPASVLAPPPAPVIAPEPAAPVLSADDAALTAARKKKLQTQMQRSGRASTILSDDSETLGG